MENGVMALVLNLNVGLKNKDAWIDSFIYILTFFLSDWISINVFLSTVQFFATISWPGDNVADSYLMNENNEEITLSLLKEKLLISFL